MVDADQRDAVEKLLQEAERLGWTVENYDVGPRDTIVKQGTGPVALGTSLNARFKRDGGDA